MSDDRVRDLANIGSVGFTLVAYVLVFTAIGYGLDRLLGSRPWIMVAGVFVGAGLGFYAMVRTLIASTERRRDGGGPEGPAE